MEFKTGLESTSLPTAQQLAHYSEKHLSAPTDSECGYVEPLTMRLNQFRLKGVGCDVLFVVGDEQERVLVHKLVLGCSSAVFNAMFYGAFCTPLGTTTCVNANNFPAKFANNTTSTRRCSNTSLPPMINAINNSNAINSTLSTLLLPYSSLPTYGADENNNSGGKENALYSSNVPGKSVSDENNNQEKEPSAVADDADEDDVADEEAESEEEGAETHEDDLLCSSSSTSADCSLSSTSSTCSNHHKHHGKARSDNITPDGYDASMKAISRGSGNPFDLQNGSTPLDAYSASSISSPPLKVQRGRFGSNLGQLQSSDVATAAVERHPPKVHFAKSNTNTATDSLTQLMGVEVIRVPDISPTAFNIMIDYIYSNFDAKCVELNDDNVMHTLYAAKKYDLHSLVTECVRYLLNGLSACNAVCLLAQARLFQEETLMQQCLEVIDRNTDVALHASNVRDIDRDTLIEVLGRSELDPSSELVIFYAAEAWAEAECERRQLAPSVENLRACLGDALQLVRFPLMNVIEFGQAASSSVLSCEEIAEVFLHLTVKPRPYCRYSNRFRFCSRSKHCVSRFGAISSKRWTKRESKICFTVDRDILVSALGIYGVAPSSKSHYANNKWSCQVEIQLAATTDPAGDSSIFQSATNTVFLQGTVDDTTPLVAPFDAPVPCAANTSYVASIRFISENSIQTFSGKDGRESVTVDLPYDDETVTFKFEGHRTNSSYVPAYGNDDCGKMEGQIPALHFMVKWPEK